MAAVDSAVSGCPSTVTYERPSPRGRLSPMPEMISAWRFSESAQLCTVARRSPSVLPPTAGGVTRAQSTMRPRVTTCSMSTTSTAYAARVSKRPAVIPGRSLPKILTRRVGESPVREGSPPAPSTRRGSGGSTDPEDGRGWDGWGALMVLPPYRSRRRPRPTVPSAGRLRPGLPRLSSRDRAPVSAFPRPGSRTARRRSSARTRGRDAELAGTGLALRRAACRAMGRYGAVEPSTGRHAMFIRTSTDPDVFAPRYQGIRPGLRAVFTRPTFRQGTGPGIVPHDVQHP